MTDAVLTIIALLCAVPSMYFTKVILRQTGISKDGKKPDRDDILDDMN